MTIMGNPDFVVSGDINPTFITAPQGDSAPDSITIGGASVWVEYGNMGDSTGASGSPLSTIVQYNLTTGSQVGQPITAAGLADGLKYDPMTGTVWVLNNNDGNSTLQFINPITQQISDPLTYGSPYVYGSTSSRGFDDVVFDGNRVFLSETNPANPGDPVIVQLLNGRAPFGPNFGMNRTLQTKDILSFGATGTDLNTGQTNQPLPMTDPDSLKLLPNGDLLLTGEADGAYIFVQNPGTNHQTESFVTLPKDPITGAVDVPDDAIMPTSTSGTFYISNQGTGPNDLNGNNIVSVQVTGLNTNDLYADITTGPNANELVQINLDPSAGAIGAITPVVMGLDNPHGLAFVPSSPDPVVAGNPPTSSLGTNNALPTTGVQNALSTTGVQNALPTTGVQNPGLDHVVALFNQSMASGFPEQHGGQITTNALSQITTNEQQFLANPHHG
jgi:hypothetical protein